jgi:hypothetical protein
VSISAGQELADVTSPQSQKEGIIVAKLTNYVLSAHYSSNVPANNAMAFVDKAAQELVKAGL